MPDALKNSGYIGGSVGTMLLGALAVWGVHMLMRSSYDICKKHRIPIMSYAEPVKAAVAEGAPCIKPYSNCFHHFVNIVLILSQIWVSCTHAALTKNYCSWWKRAWIRFSNGPETLHVSPTFSFHSPLIHPHLMSKVSRRSRNIIDTNWVSQRRCTKHCALRVFKI